MPKPKRKKQPEALTVLNRRYEPECLIENLFLHPSNARQGDCGAIHQSIEHNGFFGAILAQESTGHILSGNHTYQTVCQRGSATIPVIWVDCDDATAKRILIASNRTADLASYDNQALAELLEQVKIDETGLGWDGTGWDEDSYQDLLADLSGPVFEAEQEQGGDGGRPKTVVCPKCQHEFVPERLACASSG